MASLQAIAVTKGKSSLTFSFAGLLARVDTAQCAILGGLERTLSAGLSKKQPDGVPGCR